MNLITFLQVRCFESECEDGYSLLETLIALAILALGAAISLPHFGLLKGQSDQLDVAGVIADLKTLRDDAMLTGVPTAVRPTAYGYILEPAKIERRLRSGRIVSIASGFRWGDDSDSQITFYSDGSSTGGKVTLLIGRGSIHLTVDTFAGHATKID